LVILKINVLILKLYGYYSLYSSLYYKLLQFSMILVE